MGLPSIVVIVLNWNGERDTLACLDSLQGVSCPGFEVVVVDNGSFGGSVAAIHHRFPDQIVIEVGEKGNALRIEDLERMKIGIQEKRQKTKKRLNIE